MSGLQVQLRNEAVALVLVDDAPPDNLVKIANMTIYEESADTLRRLACTCIVSCKIFPAKYFRRCLLRLTNLRYSLIMIYLLVMI